MREFLRTYQGANDPAMIHRDWSVLMTMIMRTTRTTMAATGRLVDFALHHPTRRHHGHPLLQRRVYHESCQWIRAPADPRLYICRTAVDRTTLLSPPHPSSPPRRGDESARTAPVRDSLVPCAHECINELGNIVLERGNERPRDHRGNTEDSVDGMSSIPCECCDWQMISGISKKWESFPAGWQIW